MYLSLAEKLGRTGWSIAMNKYKKDFATKSYLGQLGHKICTKYYWYHTRSIENQWISLKIAEFVQL